MTRTAEISVPLGNPSGKPIPAGDGAQQAIGMSLRSNFVWTLFGNVAYGACQWGVLIVLAKLGSPEAVGQFSLGLAVTAPVMLFANLQLSAVQATDAMREYRFGHYLALRLMTTGLALAVIAGIVWWAGYGGVTAAVILAVGVAKASESLSDVFHGLMQQRGRMERVARSQVIKGVLSVLAMAGGIYWADGVIGGAIALALSWGLLLVLYDLHSPAWLEKVSTEPRQKMAAPFTLCWEWPALGQLAWLALPLGIVAVFFALSTNIPRYFVEQRLGKAQLGIFAAMAYVTVIGVTISNAVGQAAAPRLAHFYASGDVQGFRFLVLKLAGFAALLGAAGVLVAFFFGRPLLTLLYRPEYAEHSDVFIGVMTGAGLWCIATMFIYSATASRRNRSQAVAAGSVTLATWIASAVLIQPDSLTGAAAASIASGTAGLLAFGTVFMIAALGSSTGALALPAGTTPPSCNRLAAPDEPFTEARP
jgi:O-antigen/teichoic acid export membrane protein